MMRFLVRFFGLMLLALAFIFVIYDGMKSIADGGLFLTKFGQFWADVHSGSLVALQAAIERYASPDVWRMIFQPLLAQPVSLVFAAVGIVFVVLGRKKRPLIGYARD
jgi:hypothetical protein